MEEACKVGLCNTTTLDGSINPREQDLEESKRNKLSTYRAFCLATLGGAKALYLDGTIGNFAVGKEADFAALDLMAGQHALAWHQELTYDQGMPTTVQQAAELLVDLLACGDDRNVAETWAPGKRAYQCGARAQSMTEYNEPQEPFIYMLHNELADEQMPDFQALQDKLDAAAKNFDDYLGQGLIFEDRERGTHCTACTSFAA